MSSLQKFNNTLETFDEEVEKLKSTTKAYKKMDELIQSYDKILNQFSVNNTTLEKISKQHIDQQNKIAKEIKEIGVSNMQGQLEINQMIEGKMELLFKNNKEFYRELEGTIKIKLDDSRSQIKQLIESERGQIKQIFELEFSRNTKELSNTILSGQKSLKTIVWILGIVTITLSSLLVFKMFVQ